MRHSASLPLLLLALAAPSLSRAAESYDACTGFIDSLPATISTQGTWCLRKDLATPITSGRAIQVSTNNVAINCNGFKIGGLQAGLATMTTGIFAQDRTNVSVRNCSIRGFREGIWLRGIGHVVERNRLEGNTVVGVWMHANGGSIRGNLVLDTGPWAADAGAISTNGDVDVDDNIVDTVQGGWAGIVVGIGNLHGEAGVISNNRVRGVSNPHVDGSAIGINVGWPGSESRTVVRDNVVAATVGQDGTGIACASEGNRSHGNVVIGWGVGAEHGVFCVSRDDVVVN